MNKSELDMVCAFIRTRYCHPVPEGVDSALFLDSVRAALDPIMLPPKSELEKVKDEVYLLRGKVNDLEMRLRGR